MKSRFEKKAEWIFAGFFNNLSPFLSAAAPPAFRVYIPLFFSLVRRYHKSDLLLPVSPSLPFPRLIPPIRNLPSFKWVFGTEVLSLYLLSRVHNMCRAPVGDVLAKEMTNNSRKF